MYFKYENNRVLCDKFSLHPYSSEKGKVRAWLRMKDLQTIDFILTEKQFRILITYIDSSIETGDNSIIDIDQIIRSNP